MNYQQFLLRFCKSISTTRPNIRYGIFNREKSGKMIIIELYKFFKSANRREACPAVRYDYYDVALSWSHENLMGGRTANYEHSYTQRYLRATLAKPNWLSQNKWIIFSLFLAFIYPELKKLQSKLWLMVNIRNFGIYTFEKII